MPDREAIYDDVRRMLVDILCVEPHQVTPRANFFHDLGGESIEVLELTFRCKNQYGITFQFQDLFQPHLIKPNGELIEGALGRLAEEFPYLTVTSDLKLNESSQIQSLFTVDTIVQMIEHSLSQSDE